MGTGEVSALSTSSTGFQSRFFARGWVRTPTARSGAFSASAMRQVGEVTMSLMVSLRTCACMYTGTT